MKRVGVAELKGQLSNYLRAVEDGAEVEVIHRGRPIARIVPANHVTRVAAEPARKPFVELRKRRYEAAGWAIPSTELLLEERTGH